MHVRCIGLSGLVWLGLACTDVAQPDRKAPDAGGATDTDAAFARDGSVGDAGASPVPILTTGCPPRSIPGELVFATQPVRHPRGGATVGKVVTSDENDSVAVTFDLDDAQRVELRFNGLKSVPLMQGQRVWIDADLLIGEESRSFVGIVRESRAGPLLLAFAETPSDVLEWDPFTGAGLQLDVSANCPAAPSNLESCPSTVHHEMRYRSATSKVRLLGSESGEMQIGEYRYEVSQGAALGPEGGQYLAGCGTPGRLAFVAARIAP